MNYIDAPLTQLYCEDFIAQMEAEYPGLRFAEVRERINHAIGQTLRAAAPRMKHPNVRCIPFFSWRA